MKRTGLSITLLLMCLSLAGTAFGFENETLKYVIQYKWGLIHKEAGDAVLSLRNHGSNYDITLTGKTRPWADKFFTVRDTLKSVVRKEDFRPVSYTRLAHEGKEYSKDIIHYDWSGNHVTASTKRTRVKKGVTKNDTFKNSGEAPAYDMLSIFYYLRTLDYSKMHNGYSFKVLMFSGKSKETMRFTCLGKETIKLRNKTKTEAYKMKFTFTEEGKKSSDDVKVWVSTDSRHIPLLIIGSLSIGEIRCIYAG